jgi:general nucleoside transport system permease protein
MTTLAVMALLASTPLLLACLGELVVQRSGMINLGIEGLILVSAFAAAAGAEHSGSLLVGLSSGICAAVLLQCLFGLLTLFANADAIVTGTALNLIAAGTTTTLARAVEMAAPPSLPGIAIGAARVDPLAVISWTLSPIAISLLLWNSRFGLRLRAAGEHSPVLRELGLRVASQRARALGIEAVLAGLAGAHLSLALAPGFAENMTAGRGYIALALVIFGRWKPSGAMVGVALFGVVTLLQFSIQAANIAFPYQLLLALPFAVTLLVLAAGGSRIVAPRVLR